MGNMMRDMAHSHQIIAITHLHQIAGQGNAHYFVYKDHSASKTVSRIKKLTLDERINEIAQMIGGKNPSASALKNAREILKQRATVGQIMRSNVRCRTHYICQFSSLFTFHLVAL
jgi:DNA repair protein RecN (Recombination protein N)